MTWPFNATISDIDHEKGEYLIEDQDSDFYSVTEAELSLPEELLRKEKDKASWAALNPEVKASIAELLERYPN